MRKPFAHSGFFFEGTLDLESFRRASWPSSARGLQQAQHSKSMSFVCAPWLLVFRYCYDEDRYYYLVWARLSNLNPAFPEVAFDVISMRVKMMMMMILVSLVTSPNCCVYDYCLLIVTCCYC